MPIEFRSQEAKQAWGRFEEITHVVQAMYKSELFIPCKVDQALYRLGMNVIHQYQLESVQLNTRLHQGKVKMNDAVDLSTIEKMINARFVQWQLGFPAMQAGYDTWAEGKPQGYFLQKSLQEVLKKSFFKMKRITEVTPEKITQFYTTFRTIVQCEMERLESKGSSQAKMDEISQAMQLLAAAIAHKYQIPCEGSKPLTKRQVAYVNSIEIYSYKTMLNAKIGNWSLRQALNISTDNWWGLIFGLQEAWWGKTTALANVENKLYS